MVRREAMVELPARYRAQPFSGSSRFSLHELRLARGTTTLSVAGNAASDEATEKRSESPRWRNMRLTRSRPHTGRVPAVVDGVRGSRRRRNSVPVHSSWHRTKEGHDWIRVRAGGGSVPRLRQRCRPRGVNALVLQKSPFRVKRGEGLRNRGIHGVGASRTSPIRAPSEARITIIRAASEFSTSIRK